MPHLSVPRPTWMVALNAPLVNTPAGVQLPLALQSFVLLDSNRPYLARRVSQTVALIAMWELTL